MMTAPRLKPAPLFRREYALGRKLPRQQDLTSFEQHARKDHLEPLDFIKRPGSVSLTAYTGQGVALWTMVDRHPRPSPDSRAMQACHEPGPAVSWKGRRRGRRQDRRWARAWSPEQIARRLLIDFPDDETMRLSHEAIYQALFVQGRGALRRELTACLRTGRTLRIPRARARKRGKGFVSPEIMISQRPAEAADRAVPGHWEGDLILGLGSSAMGTLVERATRFTMLLHLPRLAGHGDAPRTKNGPAFAGHGAEAVRDAITRTIVTLPEELRRSLTWDQGAEMAQHARLKIDAGVKVYFCDPHSPWQRGTNENTNGLLRQYFPKGTDLSVHSAEEVAAVAAALNARPRKTLDWKAPAEALDEWLP